MFGTLPTPSISTYSSFNENDDAAAIKKAMKGLGTDEKAIIHVLVNRSLPQRLKIANQFQTNYGKDIFKAIKSETSGNFEFGLKLMLMEPSARDAYVLHKSMIGLGTKETAVVDILVSRSNKEIVSIKEQFKNRYGTTLESFIRGDFSGYSRNALLSLCTANRSETADVQSAKNDAIALYKAGEKQWGTDESQFICHLLSKSDTHVRLISEAYNDSKHGKDLITAVYNEFSGDLLTVFRVFVKHAIAPYKYWAEQIRKNLNSHYDLTRILISRADIDLENVKNAYLQMYKISIKDSCGPSIETFDDFDCDKDCEQIREAMKGLGTDENIIIEIASNRDINQRLQIRGQYESNYGKKLLPELESETSGNFKTALKLLFMEPAERDSFILYDAMKGGGTDERTVIEVLTTRSRSELKNIKEKFSEMYEISLECFIEGDFDGIMQRALLSLISDNRCENDGEADKDKAEEDAKKLYDAGEGMWGTDETEFIYRILSKNRKHVRMIAKAYEDISSSSLLEALESELSGDLYRIFKNYVRSCINPTIYWATTIRKRLDSNEELARLIIYRCDKDMEKIKSAYTKLFETTIYDDASPFYMSMHTNYFDWFARDGTIIYEDKTKEIENDNNINDVESTLYQIPKYQVDVCETLRNTIRRRTCRIMLTRFQKIANKTLNPLNISRNVVSKFEKFDTYVNQHHIYAEKTILIEYLCDRSKLLQSMECFPPIEKSFSVDNRKQKYLLIQFKNSESKQKIKGLYQFTPNGRFFKDSDCYFFVSKKNKKNRPKSLTYYLKKHSLNELNTPKDLHFNIFGIKYYLELVCEKFDMNEESVRLRFFMMNLIERMSTMYFPIHSLPFGSTVNGLGHNKSDMDVLIKTNQDNLSVQNFQKKSNDILSVLEPHFKNNCKNFGFVRYFPKARIPIIRLHNKLLDADCDICLYQRSTYLTSKVLYTLTKLSPLFRKITLNVKHWATSNRINTAPAGRAISNFMLSSMVIHYLQNQTEPMLPPLNCFFDPALQVPKIEYNGSLEKHFKNFFEYYENFDFKKYGISIYNGNRFSRNSEACMEIQNAARLDHNICQNILPKTVKHFQILCKLTRQMLNIDVHPQQSQDKFFQIYNVHNHYADINKCKVVN
ncbi:hypothetical protein A3Q56_05629 [Intoshia linei]|uniref:Annexin n=1 Tax=Intoshia linei TaxID=1819745 RepID=A0A177AXC5_9BILA|nr:hypothetical protein A3Q56_05629 [Intoshia linei]